MEEHLATWVPAILAAKTFAAVIRRDFGITPEPVAGWHSNVSVDAAYLAILAGCTLVVLGIGVDRALPIAILLRLGPLLSTRILIAANHLFLELFVLTVALRLYEQPAALVSVVQFMTVSVWLYAAFQKLNHGQFLNGSFFYVAFQDAGINNRWAWCASKVKRIDGDYAAADPASEAFCRRLAVLAAATEVAAPVVAFLTAGTAWAVVTLVAMCVAVAFLTRETNFMVTNLALSAAFVAPFDASAFRAATGDPLVAGIVAWFVLWPPVHAVMTRAIRFSPWKLGGWGMYAAHDPKVEIIGANGQIVMPPTSGFTPYAVLQMCGACTIAWLREYARRAFLRWYPQRDGVAGFLYRWYRRRGDRYVSLCVVIPNREGAAPVTFELVDERSVSAFKKYVGSARVASRANAAS